MYLNDRGREYFFKYSHLNRHMEKVLEARYILEAFLKFTDNRYMAWSTGKDSTSVLTLLRQVEKQLNAENEDDQFKTPVIFMDGGLNPPGTNEYLKKFDDINIYKPKLSLLESVEKYGFNIDKKTRYKNDALNDFYEDYPDYQGRIMGIRYNENSARKNLFKRGHTYFSERDWEWTCNPIYNWSFEDVFAFLVSSNTPIHPHYSAPGTQTLEHRRVGDMLGHHGSEFGRFTHVKEMYPEFYYKLKEHKFLKELTNYE